MPIRIVNNSLASAREHEIYLGYPDATSVVLANGFDTDLFHPSEEARLALRAELGICPDALLVGLVGRYHLMKDHANFLRAIALLKKMRPEIHYVLIGTNVNSQNAALSSLAAELRLGTEVRMLGARHDMEKVTAALDVACSASAYGEGFPNVIGEAMSCGVPCAVTDVGDSASIVADTGKIVSPCDPASMAEAIRSLIDAGSEARRALGMRARERVMQHFSLDAIVDQYQDLYTRVHDEHCSQRPARGFRSTVRKLAEPATPADTRR